MSDKYKRGSVSKDVPLKNTVGQFFYCAHCLGENVFCNGLSAFDQYFISSGKCNDCEKESNFAITSANKGELCLGEKGCE